MPFDPTVVVQDPRWDLLAKDPEKLAAAEDKLWKSFEASYPDYSAKLAAMTEDERQAERNRFSGLLRKKFPEKFPATSEARIVAGAEQSLNIDPKAAAATNKDVEATTAEIAARKPTSTPGVDVLDLGDAMTGSSTPPALAAEAKNTPDYVPQDGAELHGKDYVRPVGLADQNQKYWQDQVEAWAKDRNVAQRLWDYTATGTRAGRFAQGVASAIHGEGDPLKPTKGALAQAAVGLGKEEPKTGVEGLARWALGTASEIAPFAVAPGEAAVKPLLVNMAMEFAAQSGDAVQGGHYSKKELIKAGLLGGVFMLPLPAALTTQSGGAAMRVTKQAGAAALRTAEFQIPEIATGDQPTRKDVISTFGLFLAMDAVNTARAGLAGNIESRLRKTMPDVDPKWATYFANEAIYANNPKTPAQWSAAIRGKYGPKAAELWERKYNDTLRTDVSEQEKAAQPAERQKLTDEAHAMLVDDLVKQARTMLENGGGIQAFGRAFNAKYGKKPAAEPQPEPAAGPKQIDGPPIKPVEGEAGPKPGAAPVQPLEKPAAEVPTAEKVDLAAVPETQRWRAVTPQEDVRVAGRWQVVPAASLITSDKPEYDQELQPRNRNTAASQEQIAKIALGPDPLRLDDSAVTDSGSPIVDERGQVISGNGRTIGLRKAYASGRAGPYDAFVQDRARQLGLSVEGIENPVLVRQILDTGGQSLAKIAELSNRAQILQRTDAELAEADAKILLGSEIMDVFNPDAIGTIRAGSNREFNRAFVQATGDQSLRNSDGSFAPALEGRVRRAVLAAVLGRSPNGRELVRQALEQADTLGIKRQLDGIMVAGGQLLKIGKQKPQFDITGHLADALQAYIAYKRDLANGLVRNLDDYVAQGDMFAGERGREVQYLLEELDKRTSIRAIKEFIDEYARLVSKVDTSTAGLFGDVPETTAVDLLGRARNAGTETTEVPQGNDQGDREKPTEPPAQAPGGSQPEDAPAEVAGAKYKVGDRLTYRLPGYNIETNGTVDGDGGDTTVREPAPDYSARTWHEWRVDLVSRRGDRSAKAFDKIRVKDGVEAAIKYARQELAEQQDLIGGKEIPFKLVGDVIVQADKPAAKPDPNANQMTLFDGGAKQSTQLWLDGLFDNGPQAGNVQKWEPGYEQRPEAKAENRDLARKALTAYVDRVRGVRRSLPGSVEVLARAVTGNLVRQGYQSFVGQKLTKPEDAWPYIELARNPQFELLRFLMVKDGVIVDDMIVTSRLPGAVQWGDVYEAELIERIKASGADRVHQLHNHPSGRTRPSGEDVQLTASTDFSLEKALGRQILGEHIVIDHGEISIITARRMGPPGSTNYQTIVETLTNKEVAAIPDPLKQAEVPHSILGTQIDSPLDIAGALRAAKMNEPDAIYLVGRTNDGRISGIGRLTLDAFTKSDARGLALIRNFARHMGSGQVIIGNVPENISHADGIKILGAFSVNAVLDVLDTKGNSMRDKLGAREGRPDVFFGAKIGTRQVRAPSAGWPGGDLGGPGVPVPIADDPDQHMPIEMPELVKLYHDLTGGRYPKILRKLGNALGRFHYEPGQRGPEHIRLLASIFKLITPEEEAVMRADAKAYVAANPGLVTPSMSAAKLEEERFAHLYEAAYKEALTKNPKLASKVMAHELMHFVDFLPDLPNLHSRGNILGHVAAFRNYLVKSLAALPSNPELSIDPAVRKQLRQDAAKLAGKRPPKSDPAATAAWNDAVSKEYARLIQEYADANGFVTVASIKEELQPLIAWWRHGGTTMEAYFRQPWEMFAEAGSIMLNNPAAVAKRAPKFFRLFHDWLPQSRPEILREYNAIQDAIKSGTVQRDRVQHLRSELGRSTEIAGGLEQQSNRMTWREHADWFRYTFSRVFGPTLWRVKKIKDPNARGAVEQAIGDYLYRKTHHELYLARVRTEVMVPLLKAGLDFMDLAEFMFHNHVVNNRADIANPYGWTAKTSAERLAEMQRDLSPEKWAALQSAQAAFWNVRQSEVIDKVKQSEIFDTTGEDVIENRQFYHTVAPVRANAKPDPHGSDIESLLAGSFGVHVGAKLAKQYGFLGSIKNPFLATMQKDLALLNMAYRESAKRAIVESLINGPFANEWKPAEMVWTGQRREVKEIKTNRVGTLIFVYQGKIHAFYGPRALVDAFEYGDPIENRLFAAMNRILAQTWTRLWTQLNYGFWPIAYARDIGAFRDQMPGASRFGSRSFWAFRGPARAAARSSIMGEPNATAQDALRRGVVVSRVEPMGEPLEPDPIDQLLVRHNIPPASWRVPPAVRGAPSAAAPVVNGIRRMWELWRTWGQVNERTVKIAGLMYLDKFHPSMPEAKKRELAREMSGSPDFLSRGAGASYVNLLLPLYNPIVRGIESTAKSWKDRPGERAWKSIKYTLLPLLGFELLRRGLMAWLIGDDDSKDLQAMIDAVPTYDRDNYKIWPLGWVDHANKKVAYLRIPMHEGERILHVIFSKLLRADKQPLDAKGVFNVAAGQAPGINPMLKVASAWYTYAVTGVAPVDGFNGSQLMSTDEALAGQGKMKLARYAWNQLGGTILIRFGNPTDADPEPTKMERLLRLPVISNTIGRWVKVSNRGVSDRLETPRRDVEERQARVRLYAQDMIERKIAGEALTAADKLWYQNDPYFKNYVDEKWTEIQKLRMSSPEMRAVLRAGSSQEQAAVMQEIMRGP